MVSVPLIAVLAAAASRPRLGLFRQREVDQAFDGIHGGYQYPHVRAGAQPPSRAPAPPGVTVVLHDVLIIRSEEHTSELQSRFDLVCRLLLEKKKKKKI